MDIIFIIKSFINFLIYLLSNEELAINIYFSQLFIFID